MNRVTVCLTFDFDAISIWIGPMGAKSPSMISRGEFGAVGCEIRDVRYIVAEGDDRNAVACARGLHEAERGAAYEV